MKYTYGVYYQKIKVINFMEDVKKTIYLFRHGETNLNRQYNENSNNNSINIKLSLPIDIELNNVGQLQAKRNAEILKDRGIQIIYSSPLKRAVQTSSVLASDIGVEIEIVQDLIEFDDGRLSGLNKADFETILSKNYEKFFNNKDELLDYRILPNSETKGEARNRIYNCVLDICKKTEYNTIAISTHGFVLKEFLIRSNYSDISRVENCEVIKAEFNGNNLKILERIKNRPVSHSRTVC